jgi:hypothetical protein
MANFLESTSFRKKSGEDGRTMMIHYRSMGALRDVGKVLGLTEDLIKVLSSQVWGWSEEGVEPKHARTSTSTWKTGGSSLRLFLRAN